MQNGYYTTTGAMVTQFNRLDVLSNNLANVNTPGFKRDDVVISDFARIFQESRDELPLQNHTKEGAKFLNRSIDRVPQIGEQYVNFTSGGMKQTGNALDFALKREDAFFMVETPQGVRLTQNGAFTINDQGQLVTKEGYQVLPADYFTSQQYITVEAGTQITADHQGNLYFNGEEAGRLFIAQPQEIRMLTKEGDHLYTFEGLDSVTELTDADVVAQGFLETSNINPVKEMVGLIEAQRMVEMYQKVMTSHMNDLNSDAITKLAATKA